MKSRLPQQFFGNKKFLAAHYDALRANRTITESEVARVFEPYTALLQSTFSADNSTTMLPLFVQFIRSCLLRFPHFSFDKLSCWVEIAAHVFQHSFEHHLDRKQSFEYFSQVLARHALFRPPHSVHVFDYEEARQIVDYWLDGFERYYDQYQQCFEAELNEVLLATTPGFPVEESLAGGKQISREEFTTKFAAVVDVNLLQHG